jgi:hypothetical protein
MLDHLPEDTPPQNRMKQEVVVVEQETKLQLPHGEAIDRFLGLDPVKTPSIALIPIGWPKGRFGTPTRRSIDTCFFEDAVPEGVLS